MRKQSKHPVKVERRKPKAPHSPYSELLSGVVRLIEQARLAAVRSVNVVLTSTYWLVGQRIVEHEQSGSERAAYGQALLKRLAQDLTAELGRGFSERNIEQMRLFYLGWQNSQTVSAEFAPMPISQTVSAKSGSLTAKIGDTAKLRADARGSERSRGGKGVSSGKSTESLGHRLGPGPLFPLPWSHYVRLLTVADPKAREYYEREALQGGWSVRQLDRQIASLAYRRTRSARSVPAEDEILSADAHVRDPFVLEFLNLKDEYSETELEEALTRSLEQFLLELGSDFAFVARQKRLRIGTEWYRVDLLLFHRWLRCLIIVDLKLGKFTHADAGQMNLYLNYAREHWTHAHENPPVGLILCSEKDTAVAHYALGNLGNRVLAREYQLNLPGEAALAARIDTVRRLFLGSPARLQSRPESDGQGSVSRPAALRRHRRKTRK
jgi:predicted nuclease of restriction endonuclease-like (RecB) superfamily